MKPGNLRICGFERCQIRRQTKDEDSIEHTSGPWCVQYFLQKRKDK